MRTAYEEFSEDNDNLALLGLDLLGKFRKQALGSEAENPIGANFRVRWLAIEQIVGAKRDITNALGKGATVPSLEVQFVIDEYYQHNHIDAISPTDDELFWDLGNEQLLALEKIASSHETDVIRLG